jgi:hypothetical protein
MKPKPLYAGEVLESYCNGYFGSSAFGRKEVVAFGWNWLLCRVYGYDTENHLEVAEFQSNDKMMQLVQDWRDDHNE